MEQYLANNTILAAPIDVSNCGWATKFKNEEGRFSFEYQASGKIDVLMEQVHENVGLLLISEHAIQEVLSKVIAMELSAVVVTHLPDSDRPIVIVAHEPLQCCAVLSTLLGEDFFPQTGLSLKDTKLSISPSAEISSGLTRTLKKLDEVGAMIVGNDTDVVFVSIEAMSDVDAFEKLGISYNRILILPVAETSEPPQSIAIAVRMNANRMARFSMALEAVVALPEQQFLRWMI